MPGKGEECLGKGKNDREKVMGGGGGGGVRPKKKW